MKRIDVVNEGDLLTIRMDVGELIKGLRGQIEHWRGTAEQLRAQWEENEWYLGESRAALQALRATHGQLEATHCQLAEGLTEALRQRDEANWYLGEARAHGADLRLENQQLTEHLGQHQRELDEMRRLLAQIQDRLAFEATQRKALETELAAVRSHGERRGAARGHGPDMLAELYSPDGVLLYRGLPRNISRTGFAFASEQPITELPDFVEVTFRLPGTERPIEAIGRVAWSEQQPTAAHYPGGCELLDMPADCLEAFERVLAESNGGTRH